ncbi:MAG: flagellar hook capping protein [bacterium]|nr:flagellar hook capping protein [bacterium]
MLANEIANLINSQMQQTPPRDSSTDLDKNAFLLLLTKQLANQDPLNPTESDQFVSQLAQFGSLEQAMNLNSSFEQFKSFEQLTQASSLIGKFVTCLVPTQEGYVTVSGKVQKAMTLDGVAYLTLSDGSEVELSTVVTVEANAPTAASER